MNCGRAPIVAGRRPNRRVLGFLLTALFAASPCRAVAQAAFDHWKAIDGVLREIGSITNVRKAKSGQISQLATHLIWRGEFLLDLYEFERILVRDHAIARESIGDSGGVSIPAAAFYRGRALQELGRSSEATRAYQSVAPTAPARIRSLAAAWNVSQTGAGPRNWQRDVVDWREGKDVRTTSCPPSTISCALFQAILSSDVTAIARMQQEIMKDPPADYEETVRATGGSYQVEFFDALQLLLLGVGDYLLAAYVLQDVPQREALRGLALLRARRPVEAATLLRSAVSAGGSAAGQAVAWLGEALIASGKRAEGEQVWRDASGLAANMVSDARGALFADPSAALRQFEAEKGRGLARFRDRKEGGVFLARALIRAGRASEAMEVLDAVRPASVIASLANVRPDVFVLIARARYALGHLPGMRDNFSLARGELALLANDIPVAGPAHRMLQQIVAPLNVPEVR